MRRWLALLLLLAAPAAAQAPVNLNAYFDNGTTSWAVGAGWTYDGAGKMKHTLGQVGTLSQSGLSMPAPITVNVGVQRNGPSGSLLVVTGSCSTTVFNTVSISCPTGGATLTITPSPDFDGFVDYVAVTAPTIPGAAPLTASYLSFGDVGLARAQAGNTMYVTTGIPNGVGGAIIAPYTLVSGIFVGLSSQSGGPGISYGGSNLTVTSSAIGPTFVLGQSGTRASIGSGNQFSWANGTTADGTLDLGIARDGVGLARISNGGSGSGQLTYRNFSVAVGVSAGPTDVLSNTLYTNSGAGGAITITLPDNPPVGTCFDFSVNVANAFNIVPSAGESIRDAAATGSTQITNNVIGSTLRLCAVTAGSGAEWRVMYKAGTWTLT